MKIYLDRNKIYTEIDCRRNTDHLITPYIVGFIAKSPYYTFFWAIFMALLIPSDIDKIHTGSLIHSYNKNDFEFLFEITRPIIYDDDGFFFG